MGGTGLGGRSRDGCRFGVDVGVGNVSGRGEDDEFGCRNVGEEWEGHSQLSQGCQGQGQGLCRWRRTLLVAEAEAKREVGANFEEV